MNTGVTLLCLFLDCRLNFFRFICVFIEHNLLYLQQINQVNFGI